jgi:hypothetical protein
MKGWAAILWFTMIDYLSVDQGVQEVGLGILSLVEEKTPDQSSKLHADYVPALGLQIHIHEFIESDMVGIELLPEDVHFDQVLVEGDEVFV